MYFAIRQNDLILLEDLNRDFETHYDAMQLLHFALLMFFVR
jgi:hypothetical protein